MLNWALLYCFPVSFLLCLIHHRRPVGGSPGFFGTFRTRVWLLGFLACVAVIREGPGNPLGEGYATWWTSHASPMWWVVVPALTVALWLLRTITFQVSTNPKAFRMDSIPPYVSMRTPCFWNMILWGWLMGPWLPFGQCWARGFLPGLFTS